MSRNIPDNEGKEDNILEELDGSPYARKERRISNISKLLKVGRRSTSFDEEDIDQQHLSPMTTKKRFVLYQKPRIEHFTFCRKSSFLSLRSFHLSPVLSR